MLLEKNTNNVVNNVVQILILQESQNEMLLKM